MAISLISVVKVVLVASVLVVIGDDYVAEARQIRVAGNRPNGERREVFPSNRDNGRYMGRRIYKGPHRDIRRPGGLSYETSNGKDIERKGKVLERRQLRYAKRLGKMVSKFSERFVRQTFSGKSTKEFVVSPLAVHMALSMASAGARGSNLKELTKVTGARGSRFGKGGVHNAYFTLRNQLVQARKDIDVIDAVGLFVKSRIPLEMTFRQTVSQFYNGFFGTLSATPVKDINTWASTQSRAEFSDLLPAKAVNAKAEMVLASGLCVKGQWDTPFNPTKVTFKGGDGITETVDAMEQIVMVRKIEVPHLRVMRLQAILSRGHKKSGDIVLDMVPLNCTATVQDTADVLTSRILQRQLQRTTAEPSHLVLPKFHIQNSLNGDDLKNVLKELKLRKTFHKRKANFQGISSTAGLYLQKIFHKSAISFNEFGIGCSSPVTSADGLAAVANNSQTPKLQNSDYAKQLSSTARRDSSSLPTIKVDRPFVFAIRDTRFGTYLTSGIYAGGKGIESPNGLPLDRAIKSLSSYC